jgi:DNA-binding CsgD family transcriptional regulator
LDFRSWPAAHALMSRQPSAGRDETSLASVGVKKPLSSRNAEVLRLFGHGRQAAIAGDHERAITVYEAAYRRAVALNDRADAAEALFRAARSARRNSDSASSLEFITLILGLADERAPDLTFKGHLAMGHHLINAGKDAAVMAILRDAEPFFATSNITDLCEFLELHACANAMQGRTAEAMSSFDVILDLSMRNDTAEEQIVRLWTAAGNAATQGLTTRAKLLHQRSISIAKRLGPGLPLSLATMAQAWTCLCAGDLREARTLLETAELWPSNNLYIRFYRTAVGVLLGSLTHDYDLVERCLDIWALELAFKSEAPQRIGPIAAAIHECHASKGRADKATELLTRALGAIDNPDECWWLLLQTAKRGTREHVARGFLILSGYTDGFDMARAHRLLLYARSAKLEDRIEVSTHFASEAADIFAHLGWRCHEASALELAERFAEAQRLFDEIGIQGHRDRRKVVIRTETATLSKLGREIARLVVFGLTNREIAARLGMAERTVKYHLKDVFDKLGCHSRADLPELLLRH